jgi:hypothetical protein
MKKLISLLSCFVFLAGCKNNSAPIETTFPIEVNMSGLKYFANEKTDVLLKQLQASPLWQVTEDKGEIVCYRRIHENGKWQLGSNGYEYDHNPAGETEESFYSLRYTLRFSEKPFGPYSVMRENGATIADPLAGKVNMKICWNNECAISNIAIGQKGLWFEFYEQRKKESRIHTVAALAWLNTYLNEIKGAEKEISKNGFAIHIMPSDSTKTGSAIMEVCDGSQGGDYIINAWVNPMRSGYAYLKVFDVKTNNQLSIDSVMQDSKEYVGNSVDSSQLFFYNCNIVIYETDDKEHFYDSRFELWFHPSDGAKEIKLVDKTRKICGWER